ncbi:MAG: glycosyltransferase family 2 protein [Pirellulaceae bacterium]
MTKLSICIPTYKRPEILAETLAHLAALTNLDMEVVVSDNDSQDGTADVVHKYQAQMGALRYHCQGENRGDLENTQTALSMASGQYAYLLSDDDRIYPEGIQAAVTLMDKDPEIVAVYGGYQEWEPKSDRILETIRFVNEQTIFSSTDKVGIFNRFSLLWLPVFRTEIYQRFCFYDNDTLGYWRMVGMLMKYGKIAVIADLLYKHAHTDPRGEYNLTEPYVHDKHRSDFELFYGSLEPDTSDPKRVQEFVQFVSSRTVNAYMQGYRFACIKREYLKQRHFLLRARAYGLVNSDQLLAWEKGTLAYAAAERLKRILSHLPEVRAIVIEATEVMRGFLTVVRRLFPDLPKTVEVGRDEFIARDYGGGEFLLSENYDTLACRIKQNPQVNHGLQYALYDLLASLRVTNAPLNINFPAP